MTNKANEFRHLQGDSDGEYRVFPEPPEPPEPISIRRAGLDTGGVGCGVWFVTFILGLVFFAALFNLDFPDAASIWFVISGSLSYLIVYLIHRLKAAKMYKQIQRERAEADRKGKESVKRDVAQNHQFTEFRGHLTHF